jgi:hypothetical protein
MGLGAHTGLLKQELAALVEQWFYIRNNLKTNDEERRQLSF